MIGVTFCSLAILNDRKPHTQILPSMKGFSQVNNSRIKSVAVLIFTFPITLYICFYSCLFFVLGRFVDAGVLLTQVLFWNSVYDMPKN